MCVVLNPERISKALEANQEINKDLNNRAMTVNIMEECFHFHSPLKL